MSRLPRMPPRLQHPHDLRELLSDAGRVHQEAVAVDGVQGAVGKGQLQGVAGHEPGVLHPALRRAAPGQFHPLLVLVQPGDLPGIYRLGQPADVPVIFLSAYGRDELIARAFDMGAVDYVVKPFSPTELAARIRAALRKRAASEPSEPYVLGDLTIDYAERRVTLAGRPLPLIAMEYRLLAELSANAGRLLTYEHLLERVWGEKSGGDVRPMRTIVSKLRRKLGDDADNPTYIFTEPRVGYRMPKGETKEQETEG